MAGPLVFAFGGPYDRIIDVPRLAAQAGLALETRLLPSPKEAFSALCDDPTVAGGEMSVSFYLTERSRLGQQSELVALPVWISRSFRHGNIYVREDSGFRSPEDLRGRVIGLPEYGMTMAVWLRGIFSDEYSVRPQEIRWISHRSPAGLSADSVTYPSDVAISAAPEGSSLPELLLKGEIDAWIGAGTAPPPASVRRLFADAHAVERDYYRRTSIFPIMHVLVVRRSVLEADPRLAAILFGVFDQAKAAAQQRLWSTSVSYPTLPWALAAMEDQARLMGGDPWPYGLARNEPTLQALMRYLEDQGLLWARVTPRDAFVPLEPAR